MKTLILSIILILSSNSTLLAKKTERYYQKLDCSAKNGVIEYILPNKRRIDCVTKNKAIEYDKQKKMFECLGQAVYYGHKLRKRSSCGLIVKNKNSKEYQILKSIEGKLLILDEVFEIIED